MRAAAEILYIGRIGRGGAGLLGVGPGFLIRRLTGRFVERDNALTCLRYVRACSSDACCCAVCCESEGWLQADARAAPAMMTPTIASFGNGMRRARLSCRR